MFTRNGIQKHSAKKPVGKFCTGEIGRECKKKLRNEKGKKL